MAVLKAIAAGNPIPVSGVGVGQACSAALGLLEAPVPLILHCPMCHARHVDEGAQATTPHRTHACQNPRCGHLWAPAVVPTVGVWTLPGCLNSSEDGRLSPVPGPMTRVVKSRTEVWDGANASTRPCPTCLARAGEGCSRWTGAQVPMTVGEGDAKVHEERCWRRVSP